MKEREFKALYNDFGRKLYNFILWLTQNRSASDDILQNVFIKVWNCYKAPSNSDEQQKWLFAIARNASLDYFRKTARISRTCTRFRQEYYSPAIDPDASFTWQELENLEEKEQSILYLHIKIGYTYKEIADILSLNESQVRVKAFRALKKLRNCLEKKEI